MLIGNVGRDPEVRYLDGGAQGANGGAKVATFTLATTERYRDRNGELRENTEWHNIVAWRNSADLAEKYIRKGSQVYIEGKLRTRSWTDQSGQKRYTTEVTVDGIQLLGRKSDNPASEAPAGATYGAAPPDDFSPADRLLLRMPLRGPAYKQIQRRFFPACGPALTPTFRLMTFILKR